MNAFYNASIEPFAIQLSEVLTKMIYTRTEQSTGNRIIVTSARLQYMSTTQKIELAKMLADRGCLTINEMRELFNYSSIGAEGDKMLARGEYYDVIDGKTEEIEEEEKESEVEENAEE